MRWKVPQKIGSLIEVIVKRRGKSPPARMKLRAHGKPSPEQDQIGNRRAARPAARF